MDIQVAYEKPMTIEEAQRAVRRSACVRARGGGTKSALWQPRPNCLTLDISGLSGVLEYEPGEFTFTALAGTRLAEINRVLAGHGQYLPFDPLFVERGATLGGTVAANTPGPGRYHYGGIRDFLIGVKLIDGEGHLVRGGGKVVKNAAGFDLPKLVVGSLGSLGVLVELSFKVFPWPEAQATLHSEFDDLESALQAMERAGRSKLDIDSLDLEPNGGGYILWTRLAGLESALTTRVERMCSAIGACNVLYGEEEAAVWREARELAWAPEGWSVVKAAVTPGRIPALEERLNRMAPDRPVKRRYAAGGQMAWLAVDGPPETLDGLLREQGLNGLALLGETSRPRLGEIAGRAFYQRVKKALDPAGRLAEV